MTFTVLCAIPHLFVSTEIYPMLLFSFHGLCIHISECIPFYQQLLHLHIDFLLPVLYYTT